MKKKILFIFALLTTMLVSCQLSEVGEVLEEQCNTQFIVSAETSMQSRTSVVDLTRFVIEVYESDSPSGEPVTHIEQSNNTFNLLLKDDVTYTFLFWADYGTPDSNSGEYDVTDLKAVKISKQPTNPAWSKRVSFTKGEESMSDYNVALSHSVAQVNFIQGEDFTKDDNTLKVTFPETYSLNVADNSTTEIKNSGVSIPTFYTFTTTSKEQKNKIIGTSYIIAKSVTSSDDAKTVLNLATELNSGETSLTIDNVPFARNYKTNITGGYSNLYINTTNVTCDYEWNIPPTPDPGSGTGSAEPKYYARIGDYYYSDGSFLRDYDDSKTCLGIVFSIDSKDGSKGKIVSLVNTNTYWSSNFAFNNIQNTEDGEINYSTILPLVDINCYKAYSYCNDLGDGWYLPALFELTELFSSREVLDKLWLINLGEEFETGIFWSSTEFDGNNAYAYNVDGGNVEMINKYTECRVVAIRKF